MQSLLSLSSHLSVDGLIVSGVTGGGVLGSARPLIVVIDDGVVVIVVGVIGDGVIAIVFGVVAASVVSDLDDIGDLDLLTSDDLDELLLVVGDDGVVMVGASAAAADVVLALHALVLKRDNSEVTLML